MKGTELITIFATNRLGWPPQVLKLAQRNVAKGFYKIGQTLPEGTTRVIKERKTTRQL